MEKPPGGYSLLRAVHQRRLRLARLLIDGGASVNEPNSRGETPLMVACMTEHADPQGASKARIVKYLLDHQADPTLQDRSGRTALIHACRCGAGAEVVSLLVLSGADPVLPDGSGRSALVHALDASDRHALHVLLEACRARGTHVVFITAGPAAPATHRARQYLDVPPPGLGHGPGTATAPPGMGSGETPGALLGRTEPPPPPPPPGQVGCPEPPTPRPSPTRAKPKPTPVQWLPREPWIKCCPAVFHQRKVTAPEAPQSVTPTGKLPGKVSGLGLSKRANATPQRVDSKDSARVLKTSEQTGSGKPSPDKTNYQTPFVEEKRNPSVFPMGKGISLGQISFISNLSGFIRNRNAKASHNSSDSQLPASLSPAAAAGDSKTAIGKKEILSPSHSLLPSSREVLEKTPPVTLRGRNQGFPEGQGSGASALDQARPGFLPPLNMNPHPPSHEVTAINTVSGMISCGQTQLGQAAPTFPRMTKNTNLQRRRPYEQITV